MAVEIENYTINSDENDIIEEYIELTDKDVIEQIIVYHDLIQNTYFQSRIIKILRLYFDTIF
jgi:hypothetical protein